MSECLIGQTFGSLTVIEMDVAGTKKSRLKWICQCKCGNFTSVFSNNIKRRPNISCGCKSKEEDLSGQKFGALKVIEPNKEKYNN